MGAARPDGTGSDVADVEADAGASGRVAVGAMDQPDIHQAGLPGVEREPYGLLVRTVGHALYAECVAAPRVTLLSAVAEVTGRV